MAIFGRWSARQRLRRATRESLTIPTFSSSLDCTTRVIGGLWPAELSSNTAETATLAEHLKADLHRIVGSANDELMVIWRAGMADSTRRAEEDRVIDRARASAMRRVESAMRELRQITGRVPVEIPRMRGAGGSDLDTTRLMPAVTVVQPADQACTDWPVAAAEDDEARLQRLLAFVARQEPRLNWAVGVHADGTTVLVTDVAHGWIPPGIALPEGVRLLAPARRAGRAPELVGITTCCKTYTPGDSLRRAVDSTAPTSSVQPRALPAIAGLSVELGIATQRHDGLPKIVVSGSDSRSEPSQLSDRDLVESVLRDLSEAADKWEALVTQAETVTYSVDLGDVRAVANSDGRLLELTLHPGVMTGYAHGELADRVNLAITALRDEVEAENRARYGGRLQ